MLSIDNDLSNKFILNVLCVGFGVILIALKMLFSLTFTILVEILKILPLLKSAQKTSPEGFYPKVEILTPKLILTNI